MTAAGSMLAFGALCAIGGSVVTYMVMSFSRERAEDARVEAEFAPILTRWRPSIDMASHLRPIGAAVKRRLGRLARWAAELAGIADRIRAFMSRPASKPQPQHAAPARDITALDTNTVVWPTNPPPPVGRVHVDLDFAPMELNFGAWVRGENARLRHQAGLHLAGTDATGILPRIPAEEAAR